MQLQIDDQQCSLLNLDIFTLIRAYDVGDEYQLGFNRRRNAENGIATDPAVRSTAIVANQKALTL